MKREKAQWLIRQYQIELANKICRREDKRNLEERDFSPDECEEYHLLGDCLLCGAD